MKIETKVGILFVFSLFLLTVFAYMLGFISPFSNIHYLYVNYNFAGGIEVGSPVRVMGIKVGKVKDIKFINNAKNSTFEKDKSNKEKNNQIKIQIKISIAKKAWSSIRKDSKFYINLAGVIGEKFLEITPGNINEDVYNPGDIVLGEDPPRIDQLLSQSYSLAGKIINFIEDNEDKIVETIDKMNNLINSVDSLSRNVNKTYHLLTNSKKNKDFHAFKNNVLNMTDNLSILSEKMNSPQSKETYDILHKLILRLENLDAPKIKKFFQEEGIRARIF